MRFASRGNFTDTKGNLIATVLPGAGGENGFVDSAGSFHLDGRATLQFVGESGKYAYLQHMGTGDLSAGQGDIWVYVRSFPITPTQDCRILTSCLTTTCSCRRCETNSDKYKSLNQAFLWGHVTIPGAYLRVDVFTTVSGRAFLCLSIID